MPRAKAPKPNSPTRPPRAKTGGRKKGTPNKTTVAVKEAMLSVFADLQAEAGGGNAHMLGWARDHSTDFYKLSSKLLPLQVTGAEGGPVITRIELVGVAPKPRSDDQ